jgi:hypothetical protein
MKTEAPGNCPCSILTSFTLMARPQTNPMLSWLW